MIVATRKKKSSTNRAKSKRTSARKKTAAKKSPKRKSVARRKPARKTTARTKARKTTARKSTARKSASKRKTARGKARKKTSAAKRKAKKSISKVSGINGATIPGLNYKTIELEIARLTELLQTIRKKNKLVKKSLAYLEREQKKVAKQIRDAKKYLTQLKNRGIKAIKGFPDNAEEIFEQLKGEVTRISKRLGIG